MHEHDSEWLNREPYHEMDDKSNEELDSSPLNGDEDIFELYNGLDEGESEKDTREDVKLSRFERFLKRYDESLSLKPSPSKLSSSTHSNITALWEKYIDKVIDEEFGNLDEVLREPLKKELKKEIKKNPKYLKLLKRFIDILEGLEDLG